MRGRISEQHRKAKSEGAKRAVAEGRIKSPFKGQCLPKWVREKISQGNKRRIVSEETRDKLSTIFKGRMFSEETRKKMSMSHRGKAPPNKGKPMPEHQRRILLEASHTLSARRKQSETMRNKSMTQERKKALLKAVHSPDARKKRAESMLGRTLSEKHRKRISISMKKVWEEGRYSGTKRPNKSEQKLLDTLNANFPGEWKYVGGGQVIIGGLNPDYININGKKKLIELFGDYWHGGFKGSLRRTEEERAKVFSNYGFSILVIWEHQLCHHDKVVEIIKDFTAEREYGEN